MRLKRSGDVVATRSAMGPLGDGSTMARAQRGCPSPPGDDLTADRGLAMAADTADGGLYLFH